MTMIDGLVSGKLFGKPTERTGASGKTFVTAKARVATSDGESLFLNIITFSESVGAALLALDDGDSVALSGSLTPKAWSDKNGAARAGLDMVAHHVLTSYHVQRKRKAMQPDDAATTNGAKRAVCGGDHADMQDDL
jgi:single-stranded DNA-binding protein